MGRRFGYGMFAVSPVLLALAGCNGADISAGNEGTAINLARCYGADCGASAQTASAGDDAAEACAEPDGVLDAPLVVANPGGLDLHRLALSPDGSIWALGMLGNLKTLELLRYSADGAVLGTSGVIATAGEHEMMTQDLSVDEAGNAVVAIYTSEAENADVDPTERLTLRTFDPGFQEVGAPLVFRGMADAGVKATVSGSFLLGGDALENATHGVLARVTDGEPDWIQTNVPSSGSGAGIGVSALALTANGNVGVLAQRSPRWNGGPDTYEYGLSTFDAAGHPVWDLKLPTAYAGGYRAELAALPNGDFVVNGKLEQDSVLVRRVTKEGVFGWAFEMRGYETELAVDAGGRTVAPSFAGIAVISADGQLCTQQAFPQSDEYFTNSRDIAVSGEYLFMATQYDLLRFRLPNE
jgi:hypothetical protein